MAQKNLYLIRHGKASMEGSDRERILDNDGKIQATLVDLYKMAESDGETWSQLGEFYPDWSVEEVKLFITMLEELSEK